MQEYPLQVILSPIDLDSIQPFEGPLIDQSLASVKQLFDTNTFAILRICKVAVPIMAKQKGCTIVNIGSIMGNMLVI